MSKRGTAASNPPRWIEAFSGQAWALHPPKLEEINGFVRKWIQEGGAEPPAVQAGPSGNRAEDRYIIEDGIAVIPVYGVLTKRANLLTAYSGGTSLEILRRDIEAAINDDEVEAVLLDVDSPGGSVDGTKEVADLIMAGRERKPVVAYINGMGASGAYWIASAASWVVAYDTAMVGSVGVVMTHVDYSGADQKNGIVRTEIYAGKYKRIASSTRPLTEEGREYLQGIVDTYYSIFVQAVAAQRGLTVEEVLERIADAREFIGTQALEAGAVDEVGDIAAGIRKARILLQGMEDEGMDLRTLKEKHPEVYEEAIRAGAETVDVKAAVEGARSEERGRILALVKACLGEEKGEKIAKVVESGVSVEQYKAISGLAGDVGVEVPKAEGKSGGDAEGEFRREMLENIKAAAHGVNPGADGGATNRGEKDYMTVVAEYQAAHGCKKSEALQAVAAQRPDLHKEWLASKQRGGLKAVK